jgi:fluoride ion exporter CrcB/FEX
MEECDSQAEKAPPTIGGRLKNVCWPRFIQAVCWVAIFSILGTAGRIGLKGINYNGMVVPPLVWAQFFGCMVVGILQHDNTFFRRKSNGKRVNRPLHLGISVGFCGSLTSFSSWVFDIFFALAEPPTANYGYNLISAASQLIVTFGFSFVGYYFGNHISLLLDATAAKKEYLTLPKMTAPLVAWVAILLAILCVLGTALIVAFLNSDNFRGNYGFALIFSPFGAVFRFLLTKINPLYGLDKKEFPLGTFFANIIGSLVFGIAYLVQFYSPSYLPCQVLNGVTQGFCGALSTVSSFIRELAEMKSRYHAYLYGSLIVVLGVLVYVFLVGIRVWSVGGGSFSGLCNITNSTGG